MTRTSRFTLAAIGALAVAGLSLSAAPADAKSKRHGAKKAHPHHVLRHDRRAYAFGGPGSVQVGGGFGPGTYAAGPAYYSGDPRNYRNVPVGRPDAFQRHNGCYGGREQVRRGGRLVWVPNVTCPYAPDPF